MTSVVLMISDADKNPLDRTFKLIETLVSACIETQDPDERVMYLRSAVRALEHVTATTGRVVDRVETLLVDLAEGVRPISRP